MNTFSKMWNISTPKEAFDIINKQRAIIKQPPRNLEEQAISLVGIDIYKKLIQGYTEKTMGKTLQSASRLYYKKITCSLYL